MSPAEIIILSSVARMIMAFCITPEEPREYEVQIIQPVGSEQMYDVMVPRGASQSSIGDSTVVLAGSQDN